MPEWLDLGWAISFYLAVDKMFSLIPWFKSNSIYQLVTGFINRFVPK